MLQLDNFWQILFLLLAGHSVGDFAIQTEWLATNKNRHARDQYSPNDQKKMLLIWPHLLTAHSLHHGFIVYLITQHFPLAVTETILHWITDFCKNERWIDFHTDQAIHIVTKCLYAAALYWHWI